ncbi:MAG: hypothetical protein INF43_02480 [Alphaproteobacteria bacterium]|jgi:hypothetical protein|nr:hypothetical protein [Alphaproteobacteria bacterium]
MWTATHFYSLPDLATLASLPLPEPSALDVLGPVGPGGAVLVNARWWGTEPTPWAAFQLPTPQFPRREFA